MKLYQHFWSLTMQLSVCTLCLGVCILCCLGSVNKESQYSRRGIFSEQYSTFKSRISAIYSSVFRIKTFWHSILKLGNQRCVNKFFLCAFFLMEPFESETFIAEVWDCTLALSRRIGSYDVWFFCPWRFATLAAGLHNEAIKLPVYYAHSFRFHIVNSSYFSCSNNSIAFAP